MTRVKLFINDVEKKLLKSEVIKEGTRAIDQSHFSLPSFVNAEVNDKINFLQDTADLADLKAIYNFQRSIGDESGFNHNGVGFVAIPQSVTRFKFDNNLIGEGLQNNDATVESGTAKFTTAKVGTNSFDFDGSTHLSVAEETDYDFETGNKFSITFWIKNNNAGAAEAIITKANTSTAAGWEVSFDTSNKLHFKLRNTATTNEIDISFDTSIRDNKFHHVSFTYDASITAAGTKAYIDGELVTITTNANTLSSSIVNNIKVTIGAYGDGSSKITTQLDDLYIHDRELSLAQIRAIYHRGAISFISGKWGNAVSFDGVTGFFEVPDNADFDLDGQFEIILWFKAVNVSIDRIIFHKTTNGTDGIDCKINGTSGTVSFRILGTTITSTTLMEDDVYRQIRINRNSSNLVSLFVNNVLEDSATQASDATTTAKITFGRQHNKVNYFDGELDAFRWYKGNLAAADASSLTDKRNASTIMKTGGRATKITKELLSKDITVHSFGKILAETIVRPTLYSDRSPEFIIIDLVARNTSFKTIDYPVISGITLSRFTAEGNLQDILRDLTNLIGAEFFTDALENFIAEPTSFNSTDTIFEHGNDSRVFVTAFDDTEIINDLTVIGENRRYQTEEFFSGTGSQTLFNLSDGAVSLRVEHPVGTLLTAEVDFNIDILGRELLFTVAPASGASNIKVNYEFEKPLVLRGIRSSSIDKFGTHAKRLILSWIRTRADGTRFIQSFLNRFSDIRQRLRIEHPTLVGSLTENDIVRVKNDISGIDATFVIKKIIWKYPEFTTEIDVGEYTFDDFEYDKQISEKIHDLESTVTTIKDLRDFESPEEILNLIDAVTVTEIFRAIYSNVATFYGDDDVYDTEVVNKATYNKSDTFYSDDEVYADTAA